MQSKGFYKVQLKISKFCFPVTVLLIFRQILSSLDFKAENKIPFNYRYLLKVNVFKSILTNWKFQLPIISVSVHNK